MSSAFDWVDVSDGRARFCGLVRGPDEYGHDVFAVEYRGRVYYGEIRKTYAGDDVSIEICSFGHAKEDDVGEMASYAPFTSGSARVVERRIRDLVAIVSARTIASDKPSVLRTTTMDRFTGNVTFREGWIRLVDATDDAGR